MHSTSMLTVDPELFEEKNWNLRAEKLKGTHLMMAFIYSSQLQPLKQVGGAGLPEEFSLCSATQKRNKQMHTQLNSACKVTWFRSDFKTWQKFSFYFIFF